MLKNRNTILESPRYSAGKFDDVPVVDGVAVATEGGGVSIFCINRDLKEDAVMDMDLRSFGDLRMSEHIVMHNDDVNAVNTENDPYNVFPKNMDTEDIDGGRVQVKLPALSWNVIRFSKA